MTAFLPTRALRRSAGHCYTPPGPPNSASPHPLPLSAASWPVPGRGSYGFTKGDRLLLCSCVALRCDEWALLITSGRVVVNGAREPLAEASGDGPVEPREAVAPIKA
jgi:hypothetical protein